MNPLQEHAHLFANGKFRATINNYPRPIIGYRIRHGNYDLQLGYPQESTGWYGAKRCTLIARPIENMTDDEKAIWKSFIYGDYPRMIPVYAEQTAYLLSIGVYPFDQSHFDDGTVIDINEV